jgi:hypothetical protein
MKNMAIYLIIVLSSSFFKIGRCAQPFAKHAKENKDRAKVFGAAGKAMTFASPPQSPKNGQQSPPETMSPSDTMSPKSSKHHRARSSECGPMKQDVRSGFHWFLGDVYRYFVVLDANSDDKLSQVYKESLKGLAPDQIRTTLINIRYKIIFNRYFPEMKPLSYEADAQKCWKEYKERKKAGTLKEVLAYYVCPDVRAFNKKFEIRANELKDLADAKLVAYACEGASEASQLQIKKLERKDLLMRILEREYKQHFIDHVTIKNRDYIPDHLFIHQEAKRFCGQFLKN